MLQDLERRLRLPELGSAFRTALGRAADPVRAPVLAAEVLEAAAQADRMRLSAVCAERPADLARVLVAICGAAPFLVSHLMRHPHWLVNLASDELRRARTAAGYRHRLETWLSEPGDPASTLRRFKYYELARITVRDLAEDLVPVEQFGEILAELSHLADALLSAALELARRHLEGSCGVARWICEGEEVSLSFCVLALGKLGSEELNYSSDVDLIYVHDVPPGSDEASLSGGPSGLSPVEYFSRLARDFGRLVNEPTPDGFLYRIDLELRPEGQAGPLVVRSDTLANYYESWAATWEKAAFMKARPVAGDHRLGWRTIRAVDPMIYRSAMDFAGVAAIREMKEKIEQARGRAASSFDVKIGSGGIRDVEFVAQALQLLHGGRIPEIRGRSTQDTLEALAQVGVLPSGDAREMLSAYRFLRRLENRLQMESERQTHKMPNEPARVERLARAMGFEGGDAVARFEEALQCNRERIRGVFASLFSAAGGHVLDLFTRNVPQLLVNPATRGMMEDLAAHFIREIEASAHPERAMNNLGRFLQGVGRRRFYYELLLDRPELVPRLTALFAASEYFSGYLALHPRLIEPIFSDPSVLLLGRSELKDSVREIRRNLAAEGTRDETELALDALRLFHNRELINVGLLDLAGKVSMAETEAALTEIAEVCLEEALALAYGEMRKRAPHESAVPEHGEFLVVGMGKLGSREITYGSDLDVIFLYDLPGAGEEQILAAQEFYVRLAQKLIWALRTRTSEGVCYDIDARLRPSGNQGMLVTSLASFDRYHAQSAQVWERQALLRARPVAGAPRLARAFEQVRLRMLRRPLPTHALEEIRRVRARMEAELAREDGRRHDFKMGRGGQTDVETVVQLLQLLHGEHEELFQPEPIARQLERLEARGLLPPTEARILRDGWNFLRRLASRLRIIENRSISDLDEERGDLDALAKRLGYTSPQRIGGARRALLEDYRRHTSAIRSVYIRLVRDGAPAAAVAPS